MLYPDRVPGVYKVGRNHQSTVGAGPAQPPLHTTHPWPEEPSLWLLLPGVTPLSHTVFPGGCTGSLFPKLHLPQSGAVSCHNTQETRDLWKAPAYAEPQKKLSLAFLLPKTFSEEEQRKACQDLATLASLRLTLPGQGSARIR